MDFKDNNRICQSENSYLSQTIFSPSPFKKNVRLSDSVRSEIADFPEFEHFDIPERAHSVVIPRPGVVSLRTQERLFNENIARPVRSSNHFNDIVEERKSAQKYDFEPEQELPQRTSNPIILNKGFELVN